MKEDVRCVPCVILAINPGSVNRKLPVYVLLICLSVTTVAVAPSEDELKEQKPEAESEVNNLQTELTELLDKIGEMEEKLISTGEKIT